MWHMGTWDDPLVTRGGDTRSGRSVVPYTERVVRPGPGRAGAPGTIQPGGAASFLDHRGTWNP